VLRAEICSNLTANNRAQPKTPSNDNHLHAKGDPKEWVNPFGEFVGRRGQKGRKKSRAGPKIKLRRQGTEKGQLAKLSITSGVKSTPQKEVPRTRENESIWEDAKKT